MVPETSFALYSCCTSGWSPPYPEQLDVVDFSYIPGTDRTTMNFILGGRRFDIVCSGALFPSAVSAVELWPPGMDIKSVFHELAKLLRLVCGKQLISFNRENTSLMDYLHIWNVNANATDGRLRLGSPTRGDRIDELFSGVEYQDKDLPWHDWESVAVLEKMSETHYLVSTSGHRFGCYVPEGASEYEDYSVFLQEVQAWKRITNTPGIPGSIPRLTGLVHSRLNPSKLQGVLYEWAEPSKTTPSLNYVCIDEVPIEQRRAWFRQLESAVSFLHAGYASLTRNGCKGNITERITITAGGKLYLKIIHFGDVENYRGSLRFRPHKSADNRLLVELRAFLKIELGGAMINSEPFDFLRLPAEIRNKIYEILLVFPGRTRWLWGYRRQANASPATAGFLNSEVDGRGLLYTNRQIRRESLSLIVSRNNLLLDAVWVTSFLESSTQIMSGGRLERVMIGSYLRRITLTITLTWQDQVNREQSKGIKQLVRKCPYLKQVDLLIYNRRAWYWESDTLWADITKLPGVRVEEHWDEDASLDQTGTSTTLLLS